MDDNLFTAIARAAAGRVAEYDVQPLANMA